MARVAARLLPLLFVFGAPVLQATEASRPEVDRLVALAKVEGVARWFHPSDAASAVDWNAHAIESVRTMLAADDAPIAKTLHAIYDPIVFAFTCCDAPPPDLDASMPQVAWQHQGLGSGAEPGMTRYISHRTHALTHDDFAYTIQTMPVQKLRGRRLRISAKVLREPGSPGKPFVWMAFPGVEDPDAGGNTLPSTVGVEQWSSLSLEVEVPPTAKVANFGTGMTKNGEVRFDAITIEAVGSSAADVVDPGFELADGWDFGSDNGRYRIARVAAVDAPEGKQVLAISRSTDSSPMLFATRADAGEVTKVPLPGGGTAYVPLSLAVKDSTSLKAGETLESRPPKNDPLPLDVRVADIVVAWNVFRHFAPNLPASLDWDRELERAIAAEVGVPTRSREEHRDALRRLLAPTRDGHVQVRDRAAPPQGFLRANFRVVEGRIIVAGVTKGSSFRIGDIVERVDDVAAADWLARERSLSSASVALRDWVAIGDLVRGPRGSRVHLVLDRDGREVALDVTRDADIGVGDREGPATRVLRPGVRYFDLTRSDEEVFLATLQASPPSERWILDLRGYPGEIDGFIPYLLTRSDTTQWGRTPRYVRPGGKPEAWQTWGWNLGPPRAPSLAGRSVLMVDGRAMSAAETIALYYDGADAGPIVGSATAGIDGNVNRVTLPSGMRITFTGMVITQLDGRSPHFLVGTNPDIAVEPTIAGIRAGRDEVLAAAIAALLADRAANAIRAQR